MMLGILLVLAACCVKDIMGESVCSVSGSITWYCESGDYCCGDTTCCSIGYLVLYIGLGLVFVASLVVWCCRRHRAKQQQAAVQHVVTMQPGGECEGGVSPCYGPTQGYPQQTYPQQQTYDAQAQPAGYVIQQHYDAGAQAQCHVQQPQGRPYGWADNQQPPHYPKPDY